MREMEIIQHRQIDGLTLFLNTVDHRTTHVHSEWELIWILDQPLSVTCDSKSFQAEPGQMVLFSPNEPHELHRVTTGCTFLCLQISPKILPARAQIVVTDHLPHQWLNEQDYRQLQKAVLGVTEQYLQRQAQYPLYCVGQSCLIMHQLLCHMPIKELSREELAAINKRNARLKRLLQFVDDNYMDKIRLTDFAKQENCSLSYLSRFIKEVLNQNFQDYVTSVRFQNACAMINAGRKRLLDVCMESGFSDYRYFSREFQKHFDMTPDQYRQAAVTRQLQMKASRRSLHSVEHFHSDEESLEIIRNLLK
ncbi:MAG: helix-turn-helix transcriptional regulator [Oscillospiraceae bacterium]|nr:helix-turn-helix transcriptional regulator [Oscillospiraceae bacterium]